MSAENAIIIQQYQSPCGMLTLGSLGNKLCLCDWQIERHHRQITTRLQRILKAEFRQGNSPIIDLASTQLNEYFAGMRHQFSVPLLFVGSQFQKSVWSELLKIEYGRTISYRQLADNIGLPKAVRAVANANGANALSIFVPCHRVIGSNKSLTGYAGGLEAKEYLLKLELPI